MKFKRVLKSKLNGNTLVEVLIALAIVSVCSALAIIIFLNVQKSNLSFFKLKATELAHDLMKESLRNKESEEKTVKAEEFTLKRFSERHPVLNDCVTIRVIVFSSEKKKVYELESVMLMLK